MTVLDFLMAQDRLLIQVLNITYLGSVVILMVLMARFLLKRAPKWYSYALWAVVLFRLLCPFSIESPFSLVAGQVNPVPENLAVMETPTITTGFLTVDTVVNSTLAQAAPTVETGVNPLPMYLGIGVLVWGLGLTGMGIYGIVSYWRLRQKLAVSMPLVGNIYLADGIQTPFVVGIIRLRIYLPSGLSEKEQTYILMHERTHIRRLDPLWKALAYAALCIHWFNPLVWLAFFAAQKDMEMSCDERVLREMGAEIRRDYSTSLLNLAAGHRTVGLTPLAFGECNTASRIKNVLNYRRPGFWVTLAAAAVVVIVGLGLFFNPHGPRVEVLEDTSSLTSFEMRWLEDARLEAREAGCSYLSVVSGEKGELVYFYRQNTNYSYYELEMEVWGQILEVTVVEKDAASEGDISSEALARVEVPEEVIGHSLQFVALDGSKQVVEGGKVVSMEKWTLPTARELYALKNPYVGDVPANMAILEALGIAEKFGPFTIELQTQNAPYMLKICFEEIPADHKKLDREMERYAELILALIENCDHVRWEYTKKKTEEETVLYATGLIAESAGLPKVPIKECGASAENLERLIIYLGMEEYFDIYAKTGNNGILMN